MFEMGCEPRGALGLKDGGEQHAQPTKQRIIGVATIHATDTALALDVWPLPEICHQCISGTWTCAGPTPDATKRNHSSAFPTPPIHLATSLALSHGIDGD